MTERAAITEADIEAASEEAFELGFEIVCGNHGAGNASVLIDRLLARHREQARREALEEVAREVEAWFPCGTIDKPEFGAGKALRDAIRKLAS